MPFNSVGPLNALRTLVQGLTGMQGTVGLGYPESGATRVSAWIVLGSHVVQNKTTGTRIRMGRYVVFLGYRVGGDQSAAEVLIASLADLLEQAIVDDPTIGGTVNAASVVAAGSDIPEYLMLSSQEWRVFPVTVETTQQTLFAH